MKKLTFLFCLLVTSSFAQADALQSEFATLIRYIGIEAGNQSINKACFHQVKASLKERVSTVAANAQDVVFDKIYWGPGDGYYVKYTVNKQTTGGIDFFINSECQPTEVRFEKHTPLFDEIYSYDNPDYFSEHWNGIIIRLSKSSATGRRLLRNR